MQVSTLLADPDAIRLEAFVSEESLIVLRVRVVQKQPKCPLCQTDSKSLHSHYIRRVADLSWHGIAVSLELHSRKFRCRNKVCRRKVFCERLPKVVQCYGRKTVRLTSVLTLLAFALGGEDGARVSSKLNLPVSGDTLLKLIRRRNEQPGPPVKMLGVDDFAFRRGRSYGTILVDLERRCPIDLLPDRESDTLSRWLAAHPEVEIISRDRSKAYAEGAAGGGLNAVQIADRWHLLKNLGESLERLLLRHHSSWRDKLNRPLLSAIEAAVQSRDVQKWSEPMRPEVAARLEVRRKLYEQVFQLFEQGLGFEQIADLTGKSRRTIFRWIKEDSSPVRRKNRLSRLDPYRELLNQWCRDGQYNVIQLWEELQKQGYRGSSMAVRRYLHRHQFPAPTGRNRVLKIKIEAETAGKPAMPLITPCAAVLKLLHTDRLKAEEKPLMGEILKSSPEIEKAVELGREFENLLMKRDQTPLDDWLSKAQTSAIAEIKSFARGLTQDKSAVQAAVKYEWSQGQVEGQVNRLKLIKRQMYGRANFDLLKARVIYQL